MATKVLYIDDEIDRPGRDAQKIRERLHLPGEFECELRPPPKNFSDLPTIPNALLVDLELSTAPSSGEPVSYWGNTLASEVRMRNPACPIILVTRPQIITGKSQYLEENTAIDLILYKDEINRNPDQERAKILALVEGFQALENISMQEWQKVLALMKANQDEANSLREAAPPLEHGQWNIPGVARWICRVVMGFPGILYDDLTAATR
jgi:hypothetical protein